MTALRGAHTKISCPHGIKHFHFAISKLHIEAEGKKNTHLHANNFIPLAENEKKKPTHTNTKLPQIWLNISQDSHKKWKGSTIKYSENENSSLRLVSVYPLWPLRVLLYDLYTHTSIIPIARVVIISYFLVSIQQIEFTSQVNFPGHKIQTFFTSNSPRRYSNSK